MIRRRSMLDWVLIGVGLAIMLASADLLVRGAVWCALTFGISPMVVGLTLVAFGTSAPELVISLLATLDGRPEMAANNVLGSNIANVGLIVGTTALISPILHEPRSARFEVACLVTVGLIVLLPMSFGGELARWQGGVLLGLLAIFTWWLIRRERRTKSRNENGDPPARGARAALLHVAFVMVGFAGLIFGGDLLVGSAEAVALRFGLSDQIVGVTILALGTSLPELITSLVAAAKGHPEIALGNVLGSNIFNICMVFGAVAVVQPLPLEWPREGPVAALGAVMAIVLWLSLRYHHGVRRPVAGLLLASYVGFIGIAVARELG